jgi:ribosomal protein L29
MTEEEIRARLAELEKGLAEYMHEANTKVAFTEGAIAELKKLLAKAPAAEDKGA